MTAAERARRRIREEMAARDISQQDLADALSTRTMELWTQSKIGKILNGRVEFKLDVAEQIVQIVGITLTEAIRDRGLEFWAEMTPSEVRMLERIRQRPDFLHAVMTLLDVPHIAPKSPSPARTKRKRGRPLNSEIDRGTERHLS